ncbi:MAG: hypothetical protein GXO60_07700 [Epsilonproteobacteria bacterium]|nr:hypothetical protein [Campylobacterota bacterium]
MKKILLATILSSSIYAGGIFSVGHKNISVTAGTDSAYGNTYSVLGINAHYFVVDNLSVGLSFSSWLGSDPSINQLTVPITFHIPIENLPFRPYIGGFYSRTMMGHDENYNYSNYDSYGGRAGVTMQTGTGTYVSMGWVQEVTENGDDVSSRGYPEVSAGISF